MTNDQLQTLRAAIDADPALAAIPNTHDGAYDIAQAFNLPSNPAIIVWRTSVSQDEIMQNGFDWVRVDNLAVGKARIWDWMFSNEERVINPSKINVRAGIDEVWKGTAADLAVRAAVYVHCKRVATRLEALFAEGTGTSESPATMTIEDSISYLDVVHARAL
jgi:hypothetical protein